MVSMRAVVYNGPRDVSVHDVPDPRLERPTDAVVKVTTSGICGSDVHIYTGRTTFEPGRWFGHENLGEVVEVGSAVQRVKVGDMVCVPMNVACGECDNCNQGMTHLCLRADPNPDAVGAVYGYADMGPWPGGQAEYLLVPWADFNCLRLPEDARNRENDYVMLADTWPVGYHATEMAGVKPGDTVVVYGAGPVGLLAAYSAVLKSASRVMVVDHHPDRLALAEKIGAIAIDDCKTSPVEEVLKLTDGVGADCGCECVGFRARDVAGNEQNSMTLNNLVASVRHGGAIGVVGYYPLHDLGARDELSREGQVAMNFGQFWRKAQRIMAGPCPVKRYNRSLCELLRNNQAHPAFLVSHELPLERAPEAYMHFASREHGWTKVVLKPAI
jgi:glutathione-independent formaldehyde dehydrogenase